MVRRTDGRTALHSWTRTACLTHGCRKIRMTHDFETLRLTPDFEKWHLAGIWRNVSKSGVRRNIFCDHASDVYHEWHSIPRTLSPGYAMLHDRISRIVYLHALAGVPPSHAVQPVTELPSSHSYTPSTASVIPIQNSAPPL